MKVGDDVECIYQLTPDRCKYPIIFPKKGQIYIVRDIQSSIYGIGVVVEEIRNKKYSFDGGHLEPYFSIECFRKVELVSSSDIVELVKELELQEI